MFFCGKISLTAEKAEISAAHRKESKQTTLDNVQDEPRKVPAKTADSERKKQIVITGIGSAAKEDELELKVGFSLFPTKAFFSKIMWELYFNGQKIYTKQIQIPQGPLARQDFEITRVLDMKGINAGSHVIKVEMFELWPSGEKFTCASKEVNVDYVPVHREDRLIKVPTVTSVAGADLAISTNTEKAIHHEIEETMKKDLISKRDEW